MISTLLPRNCSGSTLMSSYPSAYSMPGMSGMFGAPHPPAEIRHSARSPGPAAVSSRNPSSSLTTRSTPTP